MRLTNNQSARLGCKAHYFAPQSGNEDTLYHALRRLFALCITGRRVRRAYAVPPPPLTAHYPLEALEADGFIELYEDAHQTGEQC